MATLKDVTKLFDERKITEAARLCQKLPASEAKKARAKYPALFPEPEPEKKG